MKEVLRAEIIGEDIEIIEAKNKSLVGMKGRVVDETKNLLVLKTEKGEKKILKSKIVIKMRYKGKLLAIEGKLLVGRPWERIKR